MVPLLLTVPLILSISPRMEYRRVDFPEPTLPTTPRNYPVPIFNLGMTNAVLWSFRILYSCYYLPSSRDCLMSESVRRDCFFGFFFLRFGISEIISSSFSIFLTFFFFLFFLGFTSIEGLFSSFFSTGVFM